MGIEVLREDKLVRVVLDYPETRNALDLAMCSELAEAVEAAAADGSVGCVLLAARGPAFCVGADLKVASKQPATQLAALVREFHRTSVALLTMPKPVVAAIQGVAAGGGFSLALSADVRLAGTSATFRLAYPSIGVAVDGGCSYTLPRLVTRSQLHRLIYQDPLLDAPEAMRLGLVDMVVEDDKLLEAAERQARELAGGPTRAFGEIKALMNPRADVARVLAREAEAIDRTARSPEAVEGIAAFLEKRPPRF